MPNISKIQAQNFGLDLDWFLRILSQLPPIEIELPGDAAADRFVLILDLQLKE